MDRREPAFLWLEFVILFVALPLLYRFSPFFIPPLPLLWIAAIYCYMRLKKMNGKSFSISFSRKELTQSLTSIGIPFVFFALVSGFSVWRIMPQFLFVLVRHHPLLWLLILFLYPILSVLPQSLIYRVFFFRRYRELFPSTPLLIVLSAASFSFMHLIFRNWIAIILTFLGGLLFAWRYSKTRSLAVTALEHSLYGCYLFTLGLGAYFYHGRISLQ